jgi:undecaprenyl-diphosphatase
MIAVDSFDHSVWQFFVDHRPTVLVDLAKIVSDLGEWFVLFAIGLVIGGVALRRGSSLLKAAAPAASVFCATAVTYILKAVVDRPRPPVEFQKVLETNGSMPSGHATYIVAFTVATLAMGYRLWPSWRRIRPALAVGAILLSVSMGLSRLVLGVHWISDIAAGYVLGGLIGWAMVRILLAE